MLYIGPKAYVKLLVMCQRQGYGHNTIRTICTCRFHNLFFRNADDREPSRFYIIIYYSVFYLTLVDSSRVYLD